MTEITENELLEAWDRIARTSDGQVVYRYLQKTLMGVLADADPSPSALRDQNARRKFASELMGLMSRGIDESGRSNADASRPSDRPIVFLRRPAAAVSRRDTIRDFIGRTDPELTGTT